MTSDTPIRVLVLDPLLVSRCEKAIAIEQRLNFKSPHASDYLLEYQQLEGIYQAIGMTVVSAFAEKVLG